MALDFNGLIDVSGREFLERPSAEAAFYYLRATVCAGMADAIGWEVAEQVLMQVTERLGEDRVAMADLRWEMEALAQWVARGQNEIYKLRKCVK